ncbi:MAG: F0F1 ATP synthase subunit A [Actinomycetota bacterium]|nr:F0F1 ATP synthase subunit A [Actinomycetota bacterium]
MNNLGTLGAIIAVKFHPPTTKDFVWPCWGPELHVGGLSFCYNFIFFLLTLAFAATILFFYVGLRRPRLVPGKFQAAVETGVEFVRNQIMMQMIGPEGARFLPFLLTLFFFIFFGNILEVTPGVQFPLNSRIAFPIVMALVAWVVYNYVGIRKHGFIGYAKLVMFPPGAPWWLYPLLVPIEFFTTIIIRPITLSVRLFANMVAGHFLLTVFFLGSLALITTFPYVLGLLSFGMAIVLVGFEIFVSALQAFIFAVLTASYIGGALAEEH